MLFAWIIRFLFSYIPSHFRYFWECRQGHIVSVREQRPPLVSLPSAVLSPNFPHSVSTSHPLSLANIIKNPTSRNLNNVTQMEQVSCSFSQSLAVPMVLKGRRKKSPCCSFPITPACMQCTQIGEK